MIGEEMWGLLWSFMVGAFYVLAWFGAIILLFAVAVGIVRGVAAWFPRRRKHVSRQQLVRAAEAQAIIDYADMLTANERVDAFTDGAEYAHRYLTGN